MICRTTCRVCDGSLEAVLSLGDLYISNFISKGEPDGVKGPLELVLCDRCRLLQLKHTVPAEAMYQNYWYRSGTNQSMRNALTDIANKAEHLQHLQEGDCVLDIGCNDGTLLAAYRTRSIYKVGFDPAKNLAMYSRKVTDKLVSDPSVSISAFNTAESVVILVASLVAIAGFEPVVVKVISTPTMSLGSGLKNPILARMW